MIPRNRVAAGVVAVCCLTPLVGCDNGPKRVPIVGSVTVDGQPVDGALINFLPDESKGNGNTVRVSCSARVVGGQYELRSTGVTPSESGPGVTPGWYKVTIMGGDPRKSKVEVNDRYLKPTTTPLAVEVVEEPQPGAYDLKLTK